MDDVEIDFENAAQPDGKNPLTLDAYNEWRSDRDLGAGMLAGYAPQLAEDLRRFDVVATEQAFLVPVRHPDRKRREKFDRAGIVDLPFREKSTGAIWLMDHKTFTPESWAQYQKTANLDEQASGYMSAYQTVNGIAPVGFIYNALLKRIPKAPKILKSGGLSKAADQNTTPELFCAAIAENKLNPADYAEFVAYLEANRKTFYARISVTRTTDQLRRFEASFTDVCREKARGLVYRNVSPMHCGRCTYKVMCDAAMSGVDDLEPIIAANYDVKDTSVPNELAGKITKGKRRVESFSSLGEWKQCRQASAYRTQGLVPKTTARYFRFGSGIHEALAAGYTGSDALRVWNMYCASEFLDAFGMTEAEASQRLAPTVTV